MVAQNMSRTDDVKWVIFEKEKNSDLTTLSIQPNAFNKSIFLINSMLTVK